MADQWEDPKEDISKLLRSLSSKFDSDPGLSGRLTILVGAVVAGLMLATSIYTVEPSEEAVVLRLGRYVATQPPGLHFRLPLGIERVIKVKTKIILQEEFGFRSSGDNGTRTTYVSNDLKSESLTLTGDLNVANVEWIVQYQISDPKKYLFNAREVLKNLRDISQSVLRRVVGDRIVSQVLTTGRAEIAEEAQHLTQEVLDRYDIGVRIVTVKLQDVNPPESVRPAFNEVNAAKQEQEKAINQAEKEYNTVIPEAIGKAEQTVRNAQGYATAAVNRAEGEATRFRQTLKAYQAAPTVTRSRLYLETMEEIYGRLESLTVVDKGVSGVLPVFTPDKDGSILGGKK